MPLDSSILLPNASLLQSIAQPQPIATPFEQQAAALKLQSARQQVQAGQLEAQQQQRSLEAQQALDASMSNRLKQNPDGSMSFDHDAIANDLTQRGFGHLVPALQESWTKADQAKATLNKTQQDIAELQRKAQSELRDHMGLLAQGIADQNNDPQAAIAAIGHADIDPAKAQALVQQIQAHPTPDFVKSIVDPIRAQSPAVQKLLTDRTTAQARQKTADTGEAKFEAEKPKIAADTITAQQNANQAQAEQANASLTQAAALGGPQYAAAVQQQPQTVQDKVKALGPNPTAAQVHRALLSGKDQDTYDNLQSEQKSRQVANTISQGHLNVAREELELRRQQAGAGTAAGGGESLAQGIVDGKYDPATIRAMIRKNPGLLQEAQNLDKKFGMDTLQERYGAIHSLAPGATGSKAQTITALNTLMHHSDTGLDVVDALNNGSFTPGNAIYRKFSDTFGQPAGTDFNTVRNMIAGEFAKVAQGGAPHEAEVQAAVDNLKSSNSPAQLKAGLNRMLELAGGRMVPLNEEAKSAWLDDAPVLGPDQ